VDDTRVAVVIDHSCAHVVILACGQDLRKST
jgi:hypothetical protein